MAGEKGQKRSANEAKNENKRVKLKNNITIEDLLAKKNLTGDEFSAAVQLVSNDPDSRLKLITKQLEYYFSNDNLARDVFYSNRFKEDSAKYGMDNIMDLKYIKSAKRMSTLNTTVDDIQKAIDSELSKDLKLVKIGDINFIQRLDPIPPLIGFKSKKDRWGKFGETLDTIHAAGCLVKITDCDPSYEGWQALKEDISKLLSARVCYISPISEERSSFVWINRFKNDFEVIKNFQNDKFKLEIIDSMEIYEEMLKTMKPKVIQSRSKEMQRIHHAAMSTPFQLEDLTFRNFAHLRKLLKALLDGTPKDTVFPSDSIATKALRALLEYHPRANEKINKLNGWKLDGFKIDLTSKGNESTKCFFIVFKKDNEVKQEDFSVAKCLASLRSVIHRLPKPTSTNVVDTLLPKDE